MSRVDLNGGRSVLRTVDRVFDSSVRLDAPRSLLYMTRAENLVHNLFSLSLTTGSLQRLTDNQAPNVSYSGVERLPDGTILFAKELKAQDIWLLRRSKPAGQ